MEGFYSLDNTIPNAVEMLRLMARPDHVTPDAAIPLALIEHCEGLAFIRVYKAGLFFLGGNLGAGCVVSKVRDDTSPLGFRFSAPVAIRVGGLGGGFVFGGQQMDSIVILNTKSSVRAMTGAGQLTFGGSVGLAVGPVGRDLKADVGASNTGEISAALTYSRSRGAYIAGTLEGGVIDVNNAENRRFYESYEATSLEILAGNFPTPEKATCLENELYAMLSETGDYEWMGENSPAVRSASSGRLASMGFASNVVKKEPALPNGWHKAETPNGEIYYYNSQTNVTQWDIPVGMSGQPPPPPPPPPSSIATSQQGGPEVPPRPDPSLLMNHTNNNNSNDHHEQHTRMKNLYVVCEPYTAKEQGEVSLELKEEVDVLEQDQAGWWRVLTLNGNQQGMVPCDHLQKKRYEI